MVKIKFRFSIRTTAVERVNRCRIEPVLPQNRDSKTTVVRPYYGRIVNTERCSVHSNSRTTAVQRLKAGVILRASIDRVRVFSISSSALLQQVFSHFGVTLLQLRASFRAIFEHVFRRLLSKFSSDFGANS